MHELAKAYMNMIKQGVIAKKARMRTQGVSKTFHKSQLVLTGFGINEGKS